MKKLFLALALLGMMTLSLAGCTMLGGETEETTPPATEEPVVTPEAPATPEVEAPAAPEVETPATPETPAEEAPATPEVE